MNVTNEPWVSTAPCATGRILVQMPQPFMEALSKGDLATAQDLAVYGVSQYLISSECRSKWSRRCAQIAADATDAPWLTRFIICTETSAAMGRAGFHGPPDSNGVVEVGYAIDPLHRRRGHARAAVEIMLDVARNHQSVRKVRAAVQRNNVPSRSLIDKFGFQKDGDQWDEEDGFETIFELSLLHLGKKP